MAARDLSRALCQKSMQKKVLTAQSCIVHEVSKEAPLNL
jgi:hypothetical protein